MAAYAIEARAPPYRYLMRNMGIPKKNNGSKRRNYQNDGKVKKITRKKGACRKGIHLIRDFIIPSCDKKTYGEYLYWEEPRKIFALKWKHKRKEGWTADVCVVFKDWIKLKNKNRISSTNEVDSKQTFRNALKKLKDTGKLEELECSLKYYKRYKIVNINDHILNDDAPGVEVELKAVDNRQHPDEMTLTAMENSFMTTPTPPPPAEFNSVQNGGATLDDFVLGQLLAMVLPDSSMVSTEFSDCIAASPLFEAIDLSMFDDISAGVQRVDNLCCINEEMNYSNYFCADQSADGQLIDLHNIEAENFSNEQLHNWQFMESTMDNWMSEGDRTDWNWKQVLNNPPMETTAIMENSGLCQQNYENR